VILQHRKGRKDSSPGDWPATCGPGHPNRSRGALRERGRSCQGQGQRVFFYHFLLQIILRYPDFSVKNGHFFKNQKVKISFGATVYACMAILRSNCCLAVIGGSVPPDCNLNEARKHNFWPQTPPEIANYAPRVPLNDRNNKAELKWVQAGGTTFKPVIT
jgi:hypothetical protein